MKENSTSRFAFIVCDKLDHVLFPAGTAHFLRTDVVSVENSQIHTFPCCCYFTVSCIHLNWHILK